MFSRHDDDKANPEPRYPRTLSLFTTEELTAELQRRGFRVVSGEAIVKIAWLLKIQAGNGSRDYNSPVEYFYEDAQEILDALADKEAG